MYEDILRWLIKEWMKKVPKDLIARKNSFDVFDLLEKPRKIVSVVGPRRSGKSISSFIYVGKYPQLEVL